MTGGEFLCAGLPGFALQAAAGRLPEAAAFVTGRAAPQQVVVEANPAARRLGVRIGMAAPQALGRCALRGGGARAAVFERAAEREQELTRRLRAAGERISPRVQAVGPDRILMDYAGLRGLHGAAEKAAEKLRDEFAQQGLTLRTGIAARPAMALLAAQWGLGRVAAGDEAQALAPLPVGLLGEIGSLTAAVAAPEQMAELLELLERWGIRRLGQLAALPPAALAARLGAAATWLQQLAQGKAESILNTPPEPERRLRVARSFDPAVRDLEALQAVLAEECAALALALEQHDRMAERAELHLAGGKTETSYTHDFTTPTREGRVLAAQLGMEMERGQAQPGLAVPQHRQDWRPAEVEEIELTLHLARPRRVQARLFASAPVDREKTPKLLARLAELFPGAERVGSPRLLDSHRPGAFVMEPYAPPEEEDDAAGERRENPPRLALRIYRPPRKFEPGQCQIVRRAGPWRSAGGWWTEAAGWNWDQWDAEVRWRGEQGVGLYRLLHDWDGGEWYILGKYD